MEDKVLPVRAYTIDSGSEYPRVWRRDNGGDMLELYACINGGQTEPEWYRNELWSMEQRCVSDVRGRPPECVC